jgi:hypothetical protein
MTATLAADELISARLRASDYRDWRAQVEITRGCAAPIHLRGSSRLLDRDGAVLLEREGTVLALVATAARLSARRARSATAETPTTCCSPDWQATTPRLCPRR